MASYAAQLLDELMGRNRDVNPSEKRLEISWSDPDVCKFYLCGFCPHELFTNTRADLGQCEKIHDDELTKSYTTSTRFRRMGYEQEFLKFLQSLSGDVDRRIRRGQQRLALNNSHTPPSGMPNKNEEKIALLSERINELIEKAETLGCEGNVEEAQGVLKLCDQLKEERNQLQQPGAANPLGVAPKEMEVCQVCGAFLVVGDAQQRVEEHLSGKQHMGYNKVRNTIEELKKILGVGTEPRPAPERTDERDRERRVERDDADPNSRRSRHRSRSASRHSKRSRSRSKDRPRRSRSHERRHHHHHHHHHSGSGSTSHHRHHGSSRDRDSMSSNHRDRDSKGRSSAERSRVKSGDSQ